MTALGVAAPVRLPTTLLPIRDARSGNLVGVEVLARPADGLALGSALALVPNAPAGVWLATRVTADFLTPLESSPIFDVPREDRRRLVIEISAREPVGDYALLGAAFDVVRAQGVRLALGDVGPTYELLSRVLQLRPDMVSVDRSLVHAIAVDRVKRALIAPVIHIAREVAAQLIADGVDNVADFDAVAALEVDQVKGAAVRRIS